jgi:2,3-dihydroxy-p-cumate/2,3-dihydroxybenzoate 3,4-dioxygenase
MIALRNVSYCRLGTRDMAAATRFATAVLGLEIAEQTRTTISFRSDQRAHTLCYVEGEPSHHVVGFEIGSAEEFAAAADTLDRLGHSVRLGTSSEADARCVRAFAAFTDPSGNAIELALRPAHAGTRYQATRDAGITGFSHIGLCSTDPARDEAFWTRICNARVSDRIGDAALLRIDAVHHSIALFPATRPGIQHINHQVESSDDIMRSLHFLRERSVPIVFGPGRHPTSSARFLYFTGPDGMVFEYSSGVRSIADELLYRERQFTFQPEGLCYWGARPAITEFSDPAPQHPTP